MIQKKVTRHKLAATILFLILIVSFFPVPATATITTSGDINPICDGSDPWNIPGELKVGIISDGTMTISDASAVSSTFGHIAYGASSTGIVTVAGTGSLWENSLVLYVGSVGNCGLIVSNSGEVRYNEIVIALETNSS